MNTFEDAKDACLREYISFLFREEILTWYVFIYLFIFYFDLKLIPPPHLVFYLVIFFLDGILMATKIPSERPYFQGVGYVRSPRIPANPG
jgi:hypothetical protein